MRALLSKLHMVRRRDVKRVYVIVTIAPDVLAVKLREERNGS
jgi:hypothetical protein